MAVTVSGLYVVTFKVLFDGTDVIIDIANDTVKGALFANTITPNFSTDVSYSATGEISGTGYTAGGATLAGKTVSESPTGSLMVDANDLTWSSATFSGARALQMWDDTVASDRLLALVNFGADYGVTAGLFTVQHPATGIFAIDLTP